MPLENEVVTVRADDLGAVLSLLPRELEDWSPAIRELLGRVRAALQGEGVPAGDAAAAEEPAPLPPGRWGRVELPGYRENTGWLAYELRGGQEVLVVRDWDGGEVANVIIGPMCRVVYLPMPLRRPEPHAALTAGREPDVWYGEDAEVVETDDTY